MVGHGKLERSVKSCRYYIIDGVIFQVFEYLLVVEPAVSPYKSYLFSFQFIKGIFYEPIDIVCRMGITASQPEVCRHT